MNRDTAWLALQALLLHHDGDDRCRCLSAALLDTVRTHDPESTLRDIAWCMAGHPDNDNDEGMTA